VGECFFLYQPTRVVPDQRPLNGCVCVYGCVCVRVYLNYSEPSRAVVEVPVCCGRVMEVFSGQQSVRTVSSQGLLNCAPVTGEDVERVSTGTKFALREWLGATAD